MHAFLVIIFSKLSYYKHCLNLYENVENVSALGIMWKSRINYIDDKYIVDPCLPNGVSIFSLLRPH